MKQLLLISAFLVSLNSYAISNYSNKQDSLKAIPEFVKSFAKCDSGFINVYENESRVYLEIPNHILGRDILTTITILQGAQNNARKMDKKFGYGGDSMHDKMVRFVMHQNHINLVSPDIKYTYSDSAAFKPFYDNLINPAIQSFPIMAQSGDRYLIDVSDYYLSDNELFSLAGVKTELELGAYMQQNSYSTDIKSYPTNINFRSIRQYSSNNPKKSTYPNTLWEVGSSWILLPEQPLQIRRFDKRVGYFATSMRGQIGDDVNNEMFAVANRWRLEPKSEDLEKYMNGELVEPQKPIVFYVDKNMPSYVVPGVIEAVNSWQKAFEAVGFKNAIYALPEPTKEENPEYSPDDARFSLISYKASPIPNAYGPSIVDPRSGEIIASHIGIFHSVMDLIQMWYFAMCSPSDPDARVYPLEQHVMNKLVHTVVTHEVGHTLGLRHNFMGSTNYAVDSLRTNQFIEVNGLGTSIMDYQRFNYVAQPEDHIIQENLFPRIGIYDQFAIEWGYRYYPTEVKPLVVDSLLNTWVNKELAKGGRDYIVESTLSDPRVQSEDCGDDIIYASELGMKNLQYIISHLEEWTNKEKQEDYVLLRRRYFYVLNQYNAYLGHVLRFLGGYYTEQTLCQHHNHAEEYKAVSHEDQKRALDFLRRHFFNEPEWLTSPSFIKKINVNTDERIYGPLMGTMAKLMVSSTSYDISSIIGEDSMTFEELQQYLFKYIFVDINTGEALADYQKTLQSAFLNQLSINLENEAIVAYNISQLFRTQMYKVKAVAEERKNNADPLTKAHYRGILNFIQIWEQGNQRL